MTGNSRLRSESPGTPPGNLYVTDAGLDRVQKFDSAHAFKLKWGSSGEEPGQFFEPWGIAAWNGKYETSTSSIIVVDSLNGRVQKFTTGGVYSSQVGSGLEVPTGVAVDWYGNIWVVDTGNCRVQIFNQGGGGSGGSFGTCGSGDGQFNEPQGIAIDDEGFVWVGDTGNSRIQVFNLSGQFQRKFGSAGSGAGQFKGPLSGLGFDASKNLWVADSGNSRLQKWIP